MSALNFLFKLSGNENEEEDQEMHEEVDKGESLIYSS